MTIPWPKQYTTLIEWADSLKLLRQDFDINPRLIDEEGWKEWGNRLIQSQVLQTVNAPRTDQFKDWRSWAEAFLRSLGTNQ